jgi:gluconokinase
VVQASGIYPQFAPTVVVMGVAGSGKSTLASELARALRVHFLEGDTLHEADSRAKMAACIPLTDADRAAWLKRICNALAAREDGLVVSCSALKHSYRQTLREAMPSLRFIFLEITYELAIARVAARGGTHYFPPQLVASQFEVLEPPTAEVQTLTLNAAEPFLALRVVALNWLRSGNMAQS